MFWNKEKPLNDTQIKQIRSIIQEELQPKLDNSFEALSKKIEDMFPYKSDKTTVEDENKTERRNTTNSTGFYHVSYNKAYNSWEYAYKKAGFTKSNINLRKLEKQVKNAGFPWKIIDEKLAKQSLKKSDNLNKNKRKQRNEVRYKPEEDEYEIPITYRHYYNIIVQEGMFKTSKIGRYETYELLKIFYNTPKKILVKDYRKLRDIQKNSDISVGVFFRLVYGVNKDLKEGYGLHLKAVFEIFDNDYHVPFFINFSKKDNTIFINDHDTGITTDLLKDCFEVLNNSLHPKCDIVMLMHDNQKINQKYLFYCLMNYGNDKLNELL